MAVSYEELAGSPEVDFDRKGGGGTRRFRIAWNDIAAFNAELFPRPSSGYHNPASIPGAPWLIAQKAKYTPYSEGGEASPDSDPTAAINAYTDAGCLVTVTYGVFEDDQQLGSPSGGGGNPDKSGPGGDQGSSSGQQVEYLRHEVHIGGEFLTIPSKGIRRVEDRKKAKNDIHAGMVVPQIDHRVGLAHVRTPPWAAMRAAVGKVNESPYAGALTERVMFMGCDATWGRSKTGASEWDLTYLFSEKIRSWNYFLDDSGKFKEYEFEDGSPIFATVDFAGLFANLNQA